MTQAQGLERARLAYRRAGYFVALYTQGRRVPALSLTGQPEPPVPGGDRTRRGWAVALSSRARHQTELEIMARWTALVSESRGCLDGGEPAGGWGTPAETLAVLGGRVTRDARENEAYLEWLRQRARGLVDIPEIWTAVQAVAEALLAGGTLSYRDAADIVTRTLRAGRRRSGLAGYLSPK